MINCTYVSDCTRKGADYGLFGDHLYEVVNKNIRKMASKFSSVMSSDDIMDLIQDTWLKVFDKSEQYDPNGNFDGWVYRICQNAVYDFTQKCSKRRGKHCSLPEDYEKEESPAFLDDRRPDFSIIQKESVEHIERGIATLKPEKQKVVHMLIEEVPYKTMAVVIGCRENTVKTTVCRVRQDLNRNILFT